MWRKKIEMRAKFWRGKPLVAATLVLLLHNAIAAQSLPPKTEDSSTKREDLSSVVRDVCTVSLRLAVSDLQPLLDRESLLKGVDTKVIFEPYVEYQAKATFKDKRVSISHGFCYHNWLTNWALSLAAVSGSQTHVSAYLEYLAKHTLRLEQTHEAWRVMTFEEFAKLDLKMLPAENLALAQSSAISTMRGILAFAVAHEFGHLALNHQPAQDILPMEARKQEYAADLFAIRLLSPARLPDYATLGSLLGVSMNTLAVREVGRAFAQNSSHPPTFCRQALMDREGRWLETVAANPIARKDLEKSMGRSVSDMLYTRNNTIKSCPAP